MTDQTIFEIIHNMDKVTDHLIIQWNKAFSEDLGVSHILVLAHLKMHGDSFPSDVAKEVGLTPPTITHLLEKLISKNLVIRKASESDRRMIILSITSEGEEMVKRANEEGVELRKKLFEKLTTEEREQLLQIYRKLNK